MKIADTRYAELASLHRSRYEQGAADTKYEK
jgi:hypothetical protein